MALMSVMISEPFAMDSCASYIYGNTRLLWTYGGRLQPLFYARTVRMPVGLERISIPISADLPFDLKFICIGTPVMKTLFNLFVLYNVIGSPSGKRMRSVRFACPRTYLTKK